ncbi:DUF4419 domain-containing protein [Armatimonas sp.]|uniref:DUF4419 domain-containing protein n=1 Tax=Armatimonas sp. TaxID=1872638 RepID=UPI00286AE161|nr:DUF4419 domain-containing protein [Armatimonas sp.]
MAVLTSTPRVIPGNPVTPATEPLPAVPYETALKHALGDSQLEAYSRETKALLNPESGGYAHGFIAAANTAFMRHYPLVLSPDMIWLLIVQGFAIHIQEHTGALRGKFVSHKGKVALEVHRDEFVKGFVGNDWEEVFAEFSQQIRTHIGDQAHDTLVPTFSTTGIVEKAAFEVTLLDAMQGYFTYKLNTMCGIPSFVLEGTPEDWQQLRACAARLETYKLGWWMVHLLPVLDQFVAASRGESDETFWQNFYKWNAGSGGTSITGHLTAFFPYLGGGKAKQRSLRGIWQWLHSLRQAASPSPLREVEKAMEKAKAEGRIEEARGLMMQMINGVSVPAARTSYYRNPHLGTLSEWQGMTSDEVLSGISTAPFCWKYLTSEQSMELIAGFIGVAQDPETLAIRPAIGWAVREKRI